MTPPEEGQAAEMLVGRCHCHRVVRERDLHEVDCRWGVVVRLLQERDEARLEAKAATEVAVKYAKDRQLETGEGMDLSLKTVERIVSVEKQRLIDEWKKEEGKGAGE